MNQVVYPSEQAARVMLAVRHRVELDGGMELLTNSMELLEGRCQRTLVLQKLANVLD